jgi:hypothetical protein
MATTAVETLDTEVTGWDQQYRAKHQKQNILIKKTYVPPVTYAYVVVVVAWW